MASDLMTRLRVLRAEKRLSQQDVADATNLSVRGYRNIENGDSSPSLSVIVVLANFFDVSIDYLIGRTDSKS